MPCSNVASKNAEYSGEKKIIISFDGTGGEASWGDQTETGVNANTAGLSNISKMHLLLGGDLENDGNFFDDQIALYYSGVGTRGEGLLAKIKSAINLGSMTDIYNEALEDLEKCYKKADKLYVFGFSRGAATARLFCSYLQRRGLKLGEEQIKPKITFLGVYDTVPAAINRGISNTGRYQLDVNYDSWSTFWQTETKMPEIVEKAVHLVAVDEQRVQFRPTLFDKDDRVTEIWCAGNHSDVGGGYYYDGLSDGALTYMLKALGGSFTEEKGLKYRTITKDTDKSTLVGPKGDVKVVEFDQDMVKASNPCDPHVHNENISIFEVASKLKGFGSRNIVQFKYDEDKKKDVMVDNEPILVLDNVIDRVKDKENKLKDLNVDNPFYTSKGYRPLNLKGKKYNKVNSKTGIISKEVYELIENLDNGQWDETVINTK